MNHSFNPLPTRSATSAFDLVISSNPRERAIICAEFSAWLKNKNDELATTIAHLQSNAFVV